MLKVENMYPNPCKNQENIYLEIKENEQKKVMVKYSLFSYKIANETHSVHSYKNFSVLRVYLNFSTFQNIYSIFDLYFHPIDFT